MLCEGIDYGFDQESSESGWADCDEADSDEGYTNESDGEELSSEFSSDGTTPNGYSWLFP